MGGHLRRSVSTAWQIGFGNSQSNLTLVVCAHLILVCVVGGIIAPFLFLAKDAPEYHTGYSVCLSFLCISALASTIYLVVCTVENAQRAKGLGERAGETGDEKALLGDLHPDYRYML